MWIILIEDLTVGYCIWWVKINEIAFLTTNSKSLFTNNVFSNALEHNNNSSFVGKLDVGELEYGTLNSPFKLVLYKPLKQSLFKYINLAAFSKLVRVAKFALRKL